MGRAVAVKWAPQTRAGQEPKPGSVVMALTRAVGRSAAWLPVGESGAGPWVWQD